LNRIQKFMSGRYGQDQLGMFIFFVALILVFISFLVPVLEIIAFLLMILGLYRMFSQNKEKRRQENYKFLCLSYGFKEWLRHHKALILGDKTYRYYKCPKCKQVLRVPKGKGKILITCNKCQNEFIKKT